MVPYTTFDNNSIDLAQERPAVGEADLPHLLEDAVGEGGRAGAAAGEGEDDEGLVGVGGPGEAGEGIQGGRFGLREGLVERVVGAAAQDKGRDSQ